MTACVRQVASLQGYLLRNKTRPRECVDEVAAWCVLVHVAPALPVLPAAAHSDLHAHARPVCCVSFSPRRVVSEREMREKLKKEKEEVICQSPRVCLHAR